MRPAGESLLEAKMNRGFFRAAVEPAGVQDVTEPRCVTEALALPLSLQLGTSEGRRSSWPPNRIARTTGPAGAASAQSSMTLFGVIDTAVNYYRLKSDNVGALTPSRPPSVTLSQTAMTSGNWVPSRWGFRGTEDLAAAHPPTSGSSNRSIDDGSQPLYSRRLTVNLAGVYGELRLGRDVSPTFWSDTIVDPFLNSGVGANLIGMVNARLAVFTALPGGGLLAGPNGGPANYIFINNAVNYFTPNSLSGFYGQLTANFHENAKTTTQPDSPSKRGQFYGGRFGYTNQKFDIAASYAVSTATPLIDTKVTTVNLMTMYDFGFLKLAGEISRSTNDSNYALPGPAASTSADYDGAMIGMTIPVGPLQLKSNYGYVKYDPHASGLVNPDASISKFALGATYNLSKRTLLYVTGAYTRINDGRNNPTVLGVPPQPTGAFAALTGYAPRSAMGYDLGIAHSF